MRGRKRWFFGFLRSLQYWGRWHGRDARVTLTLYKARFYRLFLPSFRPWRHGVLAFTFDYCGCELIGARQAPLSRLTLDLHLSA